MKAAHVVEIDAVRLPVHAAGHPALEFCNTLAGWSEPSAERKDYLVDYRALLIWAREVGLVPESVAAELLDRHDVADAESLLPQARELRAAIRRLALDPADAKAMRVLTEWHQRAGAVARLVPAAEPHWDLTGHSGFDLPLLAVAWSAAGLLTAPDRQQVRECPGAGCGWLFLNRTGRRRWCVMAVCGNRAKAAAFAERARTTSRKHD